MWQLEVALGILATISHHLSGQEDKKEEEEDRREREFEFWPSSREESDFVVSPNYWVWNP